MSNEFYPEGPYRQGIQVRRYLANEMHHWKPGKIQVSPEEWLVDDQLSAYNKTKVCDLLGALEFQIDKMTRNKKP